MTYKRERCVKAVLKKVFGKNVPITRHSLAPSRGTNTNTNTSLLISLSPYFHSHSLLVPRYDLRTELSNASVPSMQGSCYIYPTLSRPIQVAQLIILSGRVS